MDFVDLSADDPRLLAFHRGIYWDEFAEQHEPVESWQKALRGDDNYRLTVRVALEAETIVAGIAFELYPKSRCGLITYLVVAPEWRRTGLGRRLQRQAVVELVAAGALAVLGEVNDPRTTTLEPCEVAWQRLERNQRWGARVVDIRYVQPALAPHLRRDRELLLIALAGTAPLPSALPGALVSSFIAELYAVTEGEAPDREIAIGERARLIELVR